MQSAEKYIDYKQERKHMRKIGVLSDTQGLLRPEVIEALQGAEVILHGGDINKQKILDELGQAAPVYAVRGNNDKEWAEHLPESLTLEIFGIHIFMVHDKKFIPRDLEGVDLVIYGHSHKYMESHQSGVCYLNPGSCGPRRFRQDITMAVVTVSDDKSFEITRIDIPHISESVRVKGVGVSKGTKARENMSGEAVPGNLAELLPRIMRDIDAGRSVKRIAAKYRISEELSEQINRMYLTHPGVDADGILRRLGL